MPEKVQEVRVWRQVVVVVVTKQTLKYLGQSLIVWLTLLQISFAAVLPEDRADVLYHAYNGGGLEVVGPSIILRKKVSESVSLSTNYYVDNISSASIDVVTTASHYIERRVQNSISIDYLNAKTIISAGYTSSIENDFDASTVSFNISQDMFGDLTNVAMGVSLGSNIVTKTGDSSFEEKMNSRGFHIALTQIVSKNLVLSSALEVITDEGFLNNPYRTVRYLDNSTDKGYSYQLEVYPNTRTSNAFALRAKYYLEPKSAIGIGYRIFSDSWGIESGTLELSYQTSILKDFIFELSYRTYDQTAANFYNDLFPYFNAQEFLARDKELSTFKDETIGLGVSYNFISNGSGFLKKGSFNFKVDFMSFDYADFKDLTSSNAVSTEPLYQFDSTIYRVYLSIWF